MPSSRSGRARCRSARRRACVGGTRHRPRPARTRPRPRPSHRRRPSRRSSRTTTAAPRRHRQPRLPRALGRRRPGRLGRSEPRDRPGATTGHRGVPTRRRPLHEPGTRRPAERTMGDRPGTKPAPTTKPSPGPECSSTTTRSGDRPSDGTGRGRPTTTPPNESSTHSRPPPPRTGPACAARIGSTGSYSPHCSLARIATARPQMVSGFVPSIGRRRGGPAIRRGFGRGRRGSIGC